MPEKASCGVSCGCGGGKRGTIGVSQKPHHTHQSSAGDASKQESKQGSTTRSFRATHHGEAAVLDLVELELLQALLVLGEVQGVELEVTGLSGVEERR